MNADATTTTFAPGPTPNTVRTSDGRILADPEGWTLLSPGDAGLTLRVKAAGDHWIVQEKVGPRTTPLTGRGWAVLQEDRLNGMIVIHQGGVSDFMAERELAEGD